MIFKFPKKNQKVGVFFAFFYLKKHKSPRNSVITARENPPWGRKYFALCSHSNKKNCTFALMETNRQKKIGSLLQQYLAHVLQGAVREAGAPNLIISVTKVSVTPDLSLARAYVSIFPSEKAQEIIQNIKEQKALIKHEVAQLTKYQLRKMPDLEFFLDDSLDYVAKIESSLQGEENPIKNPELLAKRKKS